MRPLCENCRSKPCAINYYRDGKIFYRKKCETCSRKASKGFPKWYTSGYKKLSYCEKCAYQSQHPEQFDVYHVDGNLNNCKSSNLKTICANCQRIMLKEGVRWKQGDLVPDF